VVAKSTALQNYLRTSGYSVTAPRKLVFEALSQKSPITLQELVAHAAGVADRSSVYRTIELFEQLGIITRIYTGWKYKIELSDKFSKHHHHLTCISCGRTVVIHEGPAMEQAIAKLAEQAGFLADSHQLEIRGVCTKCQAH
jgi:Fur family transcriptional regulator, ferric uptake regulator